jgi:hypothetical protein
MSLSFRPLISKLLPLLPPYNIPLVCCAWHAKHVQPPWVVGPPVPHAEPPQVKPITLLPSPPLPPLPPPLPSPLPTPLCVLIPQRWVQAVEDALKQIPNTTRPGNR